jgi:hypothetical protein
MDQVKDILQCACALMSLLQHIPALSTRPDTSCIHKVRCTKGRALGIAAAAFGCVIQHEQCVQALAERRSRSLIP